jgi:hypothetical protein
MDIRQYGPALFPTVKQVRRMLDEDVIPPSHTRHDPQQVEPTSGNYDDSRTSGGK